MNPKHPEISVKLIGQDGSALAILSACFRAASEAGLPKDEFSLFFREATSGDYHHLLRTVMTWFDVA